jgi:uncharacterized protein YhaN
MAGNLKRGVANSVSSAKFKGELMRISKFDLKSYGKFTDRVLTFPRAEHDFHVIAGPNEAGKSTLRRGISELLFGMPTQSSMKFMHDELRLAAVLDTRDGECAFMRVKKRQSLRTLADEPLPDRYLDSILGTLTELRFEQLHCLDHERLLKGGQSIIDPNNSFSQILFQAASGLDGFAPLRDSLNARVRELFLARGSTNEYALASTRYDQAQKDLKKVQVRTNDWMRVETALADANERLEAQLLRRRELEVERVAWERARRLAPLVERFSVSQKEFDMLGETLVFPSNAKNILETEMSVLASATINMQTRLQDVENRQREIDATVVDIRILKSSGEIEKLASLTNAFPNHERDLPLLREEVARWCREMLSSSIEFGWGATEEQVRNQLPSEKLISDIDTLIKELGAIKADEQSASDLVQTRTNRLIELQERIDSLQEVMLDPRLTVALAQALPYKTSETKRNNLLAAKAAAQTALENRMAALSRPLLTVNELRSLKLPSAARIKALSSERDLLVNEKRLATTREQELSGRVAELALEISQFERSHKAIITLAEVTTARHLRDDRWGAIKNGLTDLESSASELDMAIRLADELVDARSLAETDGATLQSLCDQFERAKSDQEQHKNALKSFETSLEQFDNKWMHDCFEFGLAGMDLHDFPAWLDLRETALKAHEFMCQREQEYDLEVNSVSEALCDLSASLLSAGLSLPPALGLAALCELADQYIKEIERERTQRQELIQQHREENNALTSAQRELTTRKLALELWQSKWQDALTRANLSGKNSDVQYVSEALIAADGIRQKLKEIAAHRSDRIEMIEADLKSIREKSEALRSTLWPDSTEVQPSDVSRVLDARLKEARIQESKKAETQRILNNAKLQYGEAELAFKQAMGQLAPILKVAGVDDPALALPLVEEAQKKGALEAVIEMITREIEQSADGFSLLQIQDEVVSHPATEAPKKLLKLKDSLDDLDRSQPQLVRTQLEAQQAYDAIDGGDLAVAAEGHKQQALTDMSRVGEEYVQTSVSSALLQWAVDRYRDKMQGPILKRASAIFKALTLESFDRLRIDYDHSPPTLLACRANGATIQVSGLSDGSRDQLFLALRIAALELHAEQGDPIPFVADDLFINFDDQRSKAGLEVLYELSKRTQVLFLTHQEHLLPLIKEWFSGVNMIELQRETA